MAPRLKQNWYVFLKARFDIIHVDMIALTVTGKQERAKKEAADKEAAEKKRKEKEAKKKKKGKKGKGKGKGKAAEREDSQAPLVGDDEHSSEVEMSPMVSFPSPLVSFLNFGRCLGLTVLPPCRCTFFIGRKRRRETGFAR